MLPFRNLSFRYKIPLRASGLVIVTAVLVTASFSFREYDELKGDVVQNAESMGRVLAKTLTTPLVHDDVWRAFEIINSPFHPAPRENSPRAAEMVLVLDAQQQVYVSTKPSQYPMLSDPARMTPELATVQQILAAYRGSEPTTIELPQSDMIYVATPISADGVLLGTLLMSYSKSIFSHRFYGIARRAGGITVLVLAVLLPLSWYWGRRTAMPLIQLAHCMGKIGPHIPDKLDFDLYESKDEIGQVGAAFKRMLSDLRAKDALEKQMLQSERLAAIGRLSAGIAHEINNPLGGMLNAISTYKRHGSPEALDAKTLALLASETCRQCPLPLSLTLGGKTLALLERGLVQIKDTVGALLVEARVESHPLTRQDIEDTHTLVLPAAHDKSARLVWEDDIVEPLPIPSTLARQILINLLLNAIQAVVPGGAVLCHIYRDSTSLYIQVHNDGKHIPAEHMKYLFEPFSRLSENGLGLGLWVTYQIVRQLDGEINVTSEPGNTRFGVQLPIRSHYGNESASPVMCN
jgi:signal transduction histidine kinase